MSVLKELAFEVGLGKPIIRALVVGGITGYITWVSKPSMFFKPDGEARPSELLTWIKTEDSSFFPWYAVPIGAGVIAGGL